MISRRTNALRRGFLLGLWPGLILLLSACSTAPADSAESRLRQTIAAMQAAAEARDVRQFMEYIADNYHDSAQRQKAELRQLARFYFLRHRSPHILVRIKGIEWLNSERSQARVYLLTAMSGQAVDDPGLLASIRADLLAFELEFQQQGDTYQLSAAQWQRALPGDFLSN